MSIVRSPCERLLYDTFYLLVTSVAGVVLRYDSSITKSVRNDMSLILGLCVYGLTVSTNLWATCLIFIRAWYVSPALVYVYYMT